MITTDTGITASNEQREYGNNRMVLETMRSAGKPVEVGIRRFISPTLEKQPQTSLKL